MEESPSQELEVLFQACSILLLDSSIPGRNEASSRKSRSISPPMLFPKEIFSYLLKAPAEIPLSNEKIQQIPRNNHAILQDNDQETPLLMKIFLFQHPRIFSSNPEIKAFLYALRQILLHSQDLRCGACTLQYTKCTKPSGLRPLTSMSLPNNLVFLQLDLLQKLLPITRIK